ncbi:MAG: hypothetical protein QOF05_1484 [Sphingomonadales bacterium]|nr:hypothetical protein [Sphingomonadales bacterium]
MGETGAIQRGDCHSKGCKMLANVLPKIHVQKFARVKSTP